ncbi:MAG: hypothetical protein JO227_07835 [Acetobacteraceae bacterium]|nr:hypothetical protein [Acetobacteraceae bacterium]
MFRIFLIVVGLGILAALGGAIYVGLFPPNPQPHSVEKTIPNDKFQVR